MNEEKSRAITSSLPGERLWGQLSGDHGKPFQGRILTLLQAALKVALLGSG